MLAFAENRPSIIGMIHVAALPGTPRFAGNPDAIVEQAVIEAKRYQAGGIDAIAIENMHDIPYLNREVGPEIVAMMTMVGQAIKRETNLTCGIQILAGANQAAVAVAQAAELDFVRAEGFVFGHVADEGWMDAQAGELLRYRSQIGADHIPIFTDIKKKHSSHALTADVDLVETAKAAEFFLSDGLIVTGTATGVAANLEEIAAVKAAVKLPVWVGSGVTLDNVKGYLAVCDGLVIGSWFKEDGHWSKPVEEERVKRLMEMVEG
ncbi:MAG: BtpA/SgcQ family protein [Bacteroidota bacterium]